MVSFLREKKSGGKKPSYGSVGRPPGVENRSQAMKREKSRSSTSRPRSSKSESESESESDGGRINIIL